MPAPPDPTFWSGTPSAATTYEFRYAKGAALTNSATPAPDVAWSTWKSKRGAVRTRRPIAPSYVWCLASLSELLVGVPVGLTSSTDRITAVVKFTSELRGRAD